MIDEILKLFFETATQESIDAMRDAMELFEGVNYDTPFEVIEEWGRDKDSFQPKELIDLITPYVLDVSDMMGVKFSEDIDDIHYIIFRLKLLLTDINLESEVVDESDLELLYGIELANHLGTRPITEARNILDITKYHEKKEENKKVFIGDGNMRFVFAYTQFVKIASFKIPDWMSPVRNNNTFSLDLFNSICDFRGMSATAISEAILLMTIADTSYLNSDPDERKGVLETFKWLIDKTKGVNYKDVENEYGKLVDKFH